MSLVRMGLSENKKFGENYDSIFGKKKPVKTAAMKPKPKPKTGKKKK